jgi:glucose/arabinose dehydrogenase
MPDARRHFLSAGFLLMAASLFSPARAEVHLPAGFVREIVAGPEIREPMDLVFAPDGAAWVSSRLGEIWRVDPATGARHQVGVIPTDQTGDRGLHGIALHPEFPLNGSIFLSYHATNHADGHYRSRVARWLIHGVGVEARIDPVSEKPLLEWEGEEEGQHVGGGLLVHPVERLLYATSGDNNKIVQLHSYCDDPENRAQSLKDLRGKVLRIGLDGSIPASNPHAHIASAQGAVFTRGHRQPWLINYDPPTGLLLLAENGGDELDDCEEINRLASGGNYGWPKVFGDGWSTATRTNLVAGFTPPFFTYRRNTGASCTGALIYRPAASGGFPQAYAGCLFYCDYNRKSVRYAPVDPSTLKPGESRPFLQGLESGPVALRPGPDGALWLVEHGGWFQPSSNDCVTRIVWKPAPNAP